MSDPEVPRRLVGRPETPPRLVRALPRQRERSLTLPLPDTPPLSLSSSCWPHRKKKLHTYDQERSPFFKLPWEIRVEIYRMILAPPGWGLHVRMNRKQQIKIDKKKLFTTIMEPYLTSVPCHMEYQQEYMWEHRCWMLKDDAKNPDYRRSRRSPLNLGVLRVCRKVYSEATPILYESNTLSFRENRGIVNLPRAMLPHRFHSIRSLRFDTCAPFWGLVSDGVPYTDIAICWRHNWNTLWKPAWRVIASMKGLVKLRVTLSAEASCIPWNPNETFTWLLLPMKEVHVAYYRLDIYCQEALDGMVEALGPEIPFVLRIMDPNSVA